MKKLLVFIFVVVLTLSGCTNKRAPLAALIEEPTQIINTATNTIIVSLTTVTSTSTVSTPTSTSTVSTPTFTPTNIVHTLTATRTATVLIPTATQTSTTTNCIWCGTNTNYITDFEDVGYGLYIFNSHPWNASASITFTPIANYAGYSQLLMSFSYQDYKTTHVNTVAKLVIGDYYGNKITYDFQLGTSASVSHTDYRIIPFSYWTLAQNPSNPKTWQEIMANIRYVRLIDISYYEDFRIFEIKVSN